jgi:hypothetical protein
MRLNRRSRGLQENALLPQRVVFPSVYTRGVNGYQDLSSLRLGDRHSVNRKYFRATNGGRAPNQPDRGVAAVERRSAPCARPQTCSLNMRRSTTLAVFIFATLSLCACADSPPPIGRGGPRAVADVTPWFNSQVQQRFPVGSDDEKLRAELHHEAFKIAQANEPVARYQFTATYQANGLACREWWNVRWSSEQGRITDISAEWSQTCL